ADSLHCNESRSLRWDVIPARVVGGIQHSKVSLLVWQHHIRLIIASANMTEDGYCKNQEVFGVLDYSANKSSTRATLDDMLMFLSRLPDLVAAPDNASSVTRWHTIIKHARLKSSQWNINDDIADVSIHPLFIINNKSNLLEQVKTKWGSRGGISNAYVTSPFFDVEEIKASKTITELTRLLNSRGIDRNIHWYTTAEQSPDNNWLFHIPRSCQAVPDSKKINTHFYRVEQQLVEDETEHFRPLHAKIFWFTNSQWCGYICGSSNFTQRGLGLSYNPNIEANLIYIFKKDNKKLYKAFERASVNAKRIKPAKLLFGDINPEEAELEALNQSPLHFGFVDASLRRTEGQIELFLTFGATPDNWTLFDQSTELQIISSAQWISDGSPKEWSIPWDHQILPALLKVCWDDSAFAYWPVNIADISLLPPPEELRNLSLESLIEILSSQGSLRDAMRRILRRNKLAHINDSHIIDVELDPHKRVQTSHYLIPRTRRISQVLSGLKNRLERPVVTIEALHWRMYGPIGVAAVVRALESHSESIDELAFLLSELMLILIRIKYDAHEGALIEADFYACINGMLTKISKKLMKLRTLSSPLISKYCKEVSAVCNHKTITRD
ncbi:MAG: hypothetical protein LC687_06500, partial [Actinobacteria bacterium]|nr:hypothetical protein [Actinomycetota bacterium]